MKRNIHGDFFAEFLKASMAKADSLLQKFHSEFKCITSPSDISSLLPYVRQVYTLSCSHLDNQLSEQQLTEYFNKIGNCFASNTALLQDLCRLCVEIFNAHADDYFVPPSDQMKAKFDQHFEVLNSVLKIFHNFTDASVEFCLALSRIESLYKECVKPLLICWFSRHVAVTPCRLLVNSVLGFVGNQFFKDHSQIYDNLAAMQLVDPVMPYLSSAVLNIKVLALFLIAFALDESQAQLYESATSVMQFLVDSLSEATKSANRICYVSLQDADFQTYHAIELAKCINRLALNEVNKKLLVGFGLLPVLRAMCDAEAEDEVAAGLDILFTLSFREENHEAIKEQFSDTLRRLYSSDEPTRHTRRLWRSCRQMQGLNLNLSGFIAGLSSESKVGDKKAFKQQQQQQQQQQQKSEQSGEKSQQLSHVMISYQHENKQLAVRIKEALNQNNVQVWIDYERMQGSDGGSTLGLMADGVEGCYAFLMCMSRTYKDSNNCRLEAEYAYRKQKLIVPILMEQKYKPSGWLGIMLGMGMYRDFSGKYPFETKIAELVEVLHKAQLGEPLQSDATAAADTTYQRPSTTAATSSSDIGSHPVSAAGLREHHFPSAFTALPPIGVGNGASKLLAWTPEQTTRWLRERANLPDSVLTTMSGDDLHFLVTARDRDARTFYRLAERYLSQPVSVHHLARFVNALYEL